MRGRLYDPAVRRFMQADPIISAPFFSEGLNPYSYTFNSPTNYVDPSGLVPMEGDSAGLASWQAAWAAKAAAESAARAQARNQAMQQAQERARAAEINDRMNRQLAKASQYAMDQAAREARSRNPDAGDFGDGLADISPGKKNQQGTQDNEQGGRPDQRSGSHIGAGPMAPAGAAAGACTVNPLGCAVILYGAYLVIEHLPEISDAVAEAVDEAIWRASSKPTPTTSERETKEAQRAFRTDKNFRRWFHREYKPGEVTRDAGRTNRDMDPKELLDAFREWVGAGRPPVK